MVKKSRPNAQKRHQEPARQQKQQAKAARRLEAKQRRANATSGMDQTPLDAAEMPEGGAAASPQAGYELTAHVGGRPARMGSAGAGLGPQHHGLMARHVPILRAIQRSRATATVVRALTRPQVRPGPVVWRGQQRLRCRIHS
jgi:hypothetical protein